MCYEFTVAKNEGEGITGAVDRAPGFLIWAQAN